jgi:hypothetical protein
MIFLAHLFEAVAPEQLFAAHSNQKVYKGGASTAMCCGGAQKV